MRKELATVLAGMLLAAAPLAIAGAQDYPNKVITIVVPSAPGGGQDTVSRLFAEKLAAVLNQSVVVENKPGAGGSVGAQFVANSEPDGYTVLMTTLNNAINMSLYKNLEYSLATDLTGVIKLVQAPQILSVNPEVPANSLSELIALAEAKPGELNFGSSGVGGSSHLGMELLKLRTGMDVTHIPLEGTGPMVTEILSGRVQMGMLTASASLPLIEEKKVRPLGITSPERSKLAPDLPTLAELGVEGFDVVVWYGITVPAATPKPVIDKLNAGLTQVLADTEFSTRLQEMGFDVMGSTAEEFQATIVADIDRWAEVVKASGATAE